MAGANLPAKKYKKTSPTVTRLSFEFDGGSTQFIDIAMALSAINRKFYRQGVYYYVNSVEIYNNETGVVDLHTVPDNWVTKNAWNRGFKLFQKMNALAGSPLTSGQRGAYHDFKVYMNSDHVTTGSTPPNLYTINGLPTSAQTYNPDDWDYSQFVSADDDQDAIANADEFFVHMLGTHNGLPDNWTSVGLIKSYAESRSTVPDESPTASAQAITDPLVNVFDFSSEEQMNDIVENLQYTNDSPPYDRDTYVGELDKSMQHVARIGTEVGVGRVGRASGFCAPFGLICVDPHGVSTAFRVVLNLAQGTYHGVYAERA
ncbi:MAG: hypothetical protein ACO3NJ_06695 [Candidatus Poseidoniaceae archaeon]